MKRFIYFFMFLFLIVAAFGISPVLQQSQGINVLTISNPKNDFFKQFSDFSLDFHIFNSSGRVLTNDLVSCHIHIYNSSGSHIFEGDLSDDPNGIDKEIKLNSSFSFEDKGYPYDVWCNSSNEWGFLSSNYEITYSGYAQGQGSGVLVALMFIPLIFGLFLLIGAVSLGDDHIALKIFMFVLSPVMSFISFHFGIISLIKYYGMSELQDAVGSVTYWFGLIVFVLVLYVIGYFIYKAIGYTAQKKEEKLKY